MNADERRLKLDEITKRIIGCVHVVSNALGCGFVEKIYENALAIELRASGLSVKQQHGLTVSYAGTVIGEFFTDLIVEESILLELKAVKALDEIHFSQCMNYLKASGLPVCLLVNFGKSRAEVKRIVLGFPSGSVDKP